MTMTTMSGHRQWPAWLQCQCLTAMAELAAALRLPYDCGCAGPRARALRPTLTCSCAVHCAKLRLARAACRSEMDWASPCRGRAAAGRAGAAAGAANVCVRARMHVCVGGGRAHTNQAVALPSSLPRLQLDRPRRTACVRRCPGAHHCPDARRCVQEGLHGGGDAGPDGRDVDEPGGGAVDRRRQLRQRRVVAGRGKRAPARRMHGRGEVGPGQAGAARVGPGRGRGRGPYLAVVAVGATWQLKEGPTHPSSAPAGADADQPQRHRVM